MIVAVQSATIFRFERRFIVHRIKELLHNETPSSFFKTGLFYNDLELTNKNPLALFLKYTCSNLATFRSISLHPLALISITRTNLNFLSHI